MGLIVKPADYTATTLTPTALNDLKNTIYDAFGTTANLQGAINYLNVAVSAALRATQIADTGVVCGNTVNAGTQTITRPTVFGANALRMDYSASNRTSATLIADGATSIAIADAAKQFQNYYYDSGSGSNASIATITGATAGRVYTFIIDNQDNTQTPIFTADTAAVTANSLKTRANANITAAASTITNMGTYLYGDPTGSGNNAWWEL